MNLDNWPHVAGRYYIGNKNSCVAVCTLASIDLLENFNKPEYLSKIAIIGKDVTENIGIEKIVQNTITNPYIRFIILCGRESEGHYVGQAIRALVDNGLDENKRIVQAKGPIPFIKNLTLEQVDTFRKQVKIIDLIGCEDIPTILAKAEELEKNNPGVFESKVGLTEVETIVADYDHKKEWSADEKRDEGWFAILVDPNKQNIIAEYYVGYGNESKLKCRIIGKTAEQIIGTIVKKGLVKGLYHAGYLGKELEKAEIALKENKPYEQDDRVE
ncbi:MAG: tetrahydromethanopterin S-methyltransferase subunit A [Candidatus Aenigmatarchaeota archaeon]